MAALSPPVAHAVGGGVRIDGEEGVRRLPLPDGTFELSWVHSVERTEWRETFRVDREGNILLSGLPNPGVMDIATSQEIVLIPIEAEVVKRLNKEHPFFVPAVIPKGTYKGQAADVPTVAIPNFLITRSDIDDKTIYDVTKAMFENLDRLVQAHAGAAVGVYIFWDYQGLVMRAGVPTIPTYIITSTMAAPALAVFGVKPLVAHMFVFYFGLLADLTPPVALAAFAGAGIAKADPTKTGFAAVRLALAGFVVPFIFVYDNSLLLLNTTFPGAVYITLTATAGVVFLGAGAIGYLLTGAKLYERALFIAGALLLIIPGWITDAIGLSMGLLGVASQLVRRKIAAKTGGADRA